MSERDLHLAISMPVSMMPTPAVPAVKMPCRTCGCEVWVSCRTIEATTGAECFPCALRSGLIAFAVVLAQTRAELRGLGWSDDEIDRVHAKIRAAAGGQEAHT